MSEVAMLEVGCWMRDDKAKILEFVEWMESVNPTEEMMLKVVRKVG